MCSGQPVSKKLFDFGSMGRRYGRAKKNKGGGVRGTCVFLGTPKRPKMPKNRIWGPVEAVSGKFSGDLKLAHGDSATDEPNPDFELLGLGYVENTGLRARRRWGLCLGT